MEEELDALRVLWQQTIFFGVLHKDLCDPYPKALRDHSYIWIESLRLCSQDLY